MLTVGGVICLKEQFLFKSASRLVILWILTITHRPLFMGVCEVVIETDKQIYSLNLMSVRDLEAMVTHITASLKKIFPDSSPGWVTC